MFKILFVYLFIIMQGSITSIGCSTYKIMTEMAFRAQEILFTVLNAPFGNIEVWLNSKTRTWSIFMVNKDKTMACFKASGKGYEINE